MVLLDIPGLKTRIRELIPLYTPKQDSHEFLQDDMYRNMKEALRSLTYNTVITQPSYWTAASLRIVDAADFQKCMASVAKTKLGEGVFGSVVKMPSRPCLSHQIPKGVSKVAVKTEIVRPRYGFPQTPDGVRNAFAIAKKAAALHIGPQIYDVFIVIEDDGVTKIVKVHEVIEGKTWRDVVWKSPDARTAARKRLGDLIRKMNRAGIVHHDLHSGNVMVSKKEEIYIIDYDAANFVTEEEQASLSGFNISYHPYYEPKGVLSDGGIEFLFQELVKDGSIVLPGASSIKKNTRNTRNTKKTQKTKKTRKRKN